MNGGNFNFIPDLSDNGKIRAKTDLLPKIYFSCSVSE